MTDYGNYMEDWLEAGLEEPREHGGSLVGRRQPPDDPRTSQDSGPTHRSRAVELEHGGSEQQRPDAVWDAEKKYIICYRTRPIDPLHLIAEVKGIYAGLVILESKCIEVDNAQKDAKLNNEQWKALIALHRTLLHEHHDFFLASQHPIASPSLKELGAKYYMPGRMWKHGIHAFLELLRHRLPASLEHMLTFIYLAYSMMALLYETVPAFEATWMECLGDLGRYRMAIEDDDIRDREVWTAVSKRWYSKVSDVVPGTGRLYHHLAILARPNVLQQLCFYSKALYAPDPFFAALESIKTLFDPLLCSTSQHSRLLPIDFAYVKAHGLLFTGETGSEYETAVDEFVKNLDNHISGTTRGWMECGYLIAISNCCALISWGENSFIYQTIRPRRVQGEKEETEEGYKNRSIPDQNEYKNAEAREKARHLAERTYSKVLRRFADPKILPFLHSTFVFYRFMISYPSAMELLEGAFPWKMVSMLLNSLLPSCRDFERIQSSEFPRQVKQLPRPLPEDFALRGLFWADFPSDWFSNDKIDDDEKYFEVASMTDERKERILWLAVCIARQGKGKWLIYDDKLHQFSVPPRFEQEVDINMNFDAEMATISEADTLSRASTLALSSSGDKAIGEAEKDENMPDIDDFMTEKPIIRQ